MNILVTGGRGLLGLAVARDLAAHEHELTIITSQTPRAGPKGVQSVHADVRDRNALTAVIAAGQYDAIVHLAALGNVRDSFTDPILYYDVNLTGTINLLAALQAGQAHPAVVFASTQAVYGPDHDRPIGEDSPPDPRSPYAASKLHAERILEFTANNGTLGSAALRFSNLAGGAGSTPDARTAGLIPKVLDAAATGTALPVNGDGSAVRDYLHVADAAAAVRLAIGRARSGDHHTYNIGSGHGTAVNDVITAAQAATGHKITVERLPDANEPHALVADITRARTELGWHPARSTIDTIVRDAWTARVTSAAD